MSHQTKGYYKVITWSCRNQARHWEPLKEEHALGVSRGTCSCVLTCLSPALTGLDCDSEIPGHGACVSHVRLYPPYKTYQIFVQPSRRQLPPLYLDVERKLLRLFMDVLLWSECPLLCLLRVIMLHFVALMRQMATDRRPYTLP
jgi:hypothetical protein